jgi:hypothetical protein
MRIAFPTDEHFPYQDEKARQLALKIVQDFKPHVLISGSDGLDFYSLSDFDKNPDRTNGLQEEIDQWQAGQREWRDVAPESKSFFLIGNHEDRLRKFLWRHPEIADLESLKLPQLLGLEKLGIVWEYAKGENANRELCLFNLVIKHGKFIRRGSGMSARAELENEKFARSTLTGHTHRGGSHYAATRDGAVQAHECYCLCRLDPEYVQHPDWQQGIVLAEVTSQSLSVESILFNNSKAVWRGQEYRSN